MATVEGLQELLKALDETSLNLVQKRKLIVKALRAGSKPVESEMKARMLKDTGEAAESVSTSVVGQTYTGAEAQIGPRRFYPKFSELGTVFQSAKPRVGPAFDATEDEALEIIGDVLGDGIEDSYNHG